MLWASPTATVESEGRRETSQMRSGVNKGGERGEAEVDERLHSLRSLCPYTTVSGDRVVDGVDGVDGLDGVDGVDGEDDVDDVDGLDDVDDVDDIDDVDDVDDVEGINGADEDPCRRVPEGARSVLYSNPTVGE